MTGLEKLQGIGAHKIFEQTHIAKKFVEDILNKNFSTMSKIQFTGFLSILEREYNIDLHELQEEYIKSSSTENVKGEEPFVVSQQNENETKSMNKTAYIFVAILVVGALFMLFKPESKPIDTGMEGPKQVHEEPAENELNNSIIEEAKLNLNNLEVQDPVVHVVKEEMVEPVHTSKFVIAPRSKLWIGIVDLETYKRTQKMSANSFELDPDKEWLLVMGHGYVNFEVNGEEKKYKDESKVWFGYENGTLTKLSRSEFKEKNRGKAW